MHREKIFIQGYGFSGASLIRDYLYEFSNIAHLGKNEFNIGRYSGGIYEIGSIIENAYDFVKDSVFRKFIRMIEFENNHLYPFLGSDFLKLSNEFKDKFVEFTIKSEELSFAPNETILMPDKRTGIFPYKLRFINKFLNKYILKQYNEMFLDEVRNRNFNKNILYVKNMEKNEYVKIAKEYLENILNLLPIDKKIVLVHPVNIIGVKSDDSAQYWDNYKVVIPEKDPRDIYTAMSNGKSPYLERYKNNPDYFIKDFKNSRKYHEHNKNLFGNNVIEIQCEDFIYNYDRISQKLNSFLDLKEENHINKMKLFNPEISKNFVGSYKNYKNQEEIKKIEKELEKYCYFPKGQ